MLSDEVENFKREIQISASSTFLNLYEAILSCTGYSKEEMASFFICNNNWRKKQEITLIEMDLDSDEDSYVMEETYLEDFLEDEKDKLMFVFDMLNERALYLELAEIITGKELKKAKCTLSEGVPPQQVELMNDVSIETVTGGELGETFYGDESFDMDELDKDGFDGLDDAPADIDASDLY